MQILHLCRLFAPHIGGVETHVEQIALVQLQRGHSVTIITTQHEPAMLLTEVRPDGLRVVRLPAQYAEQKFATWHWILQNRQLFSEAGRIQVHDVFWWLLPIYWQNRTQIVTTFHGWETHWPIPWTAKLQRRLFSWFSAKVVHIGGWIAQYYGDTPDLVMYGGVEQRFLDLPAPKKLHAQQPLRIVFIGRLEPDTAVPEYIQLIRELKRSGKKITCIWVGDGSLRSTCEQVGIVVGWQKDILQQLRVSDVVCASSYLSMLQAQAAGRLVISLYSNELKKQYLKNYIGSQQCIISGSSKDAAQQLKELLAQPEALRDMQIGAKTIAATQTWQHIADEYDSLWQQ